MPTYQYRCTECGNQLEVVQKFTDPALTECESCHGSLRKVYNAVGVVFKGSGFYRTDSRKADGNGSAGAKPGEKSDKTAASGKSDSSGSKSESAGSKSESAGGKSESASGRSEKKTPAAASSTAA